MEGTTHFAAHTRNIAVIAHVDHGKTTICDSLLTKAGLLNHKKSGKACAMDTTAEEQERGITIHSTAVSMSFDMPDDVRCELEARCHAEHQKTGSAAGDADLTPPTPPPPTPLYLGNLSFGVDEAEVMAMVAAEDEGATLLKFNPKRGFAVVSPSCTAKAKGLLALNGTTFKDRTLTVQLFGRSARHRLRKIFQEAGLGNLSDIAPTENGGVVLPKGLGLVQLPPRSKGAVAAKEAMAQSVVDYMEQYATPKSEGGAAEAEHEYEHEHEHEKPSSESDLSLGGVGTGSDSDVAPSQLTVNCIDSPGHVDFNSEVTAALRITDGALVIVDALDGPCVMTYTVLKQALKERVRPVLLLNKVDRLILEQQLTPPEIMDRFTMSIDKINACIASEQESMRAEQGDVPDWRVSLESGTVAFGSGYFGWVCTVPTAIERMAARIVAMPPSEQPPWVLEAGLQSHEVLSRIQEEWFGPKAFRSSVCKLILRPLKQLHKLSQAQYDTQASGGGGGPSAPGPTALTPALGELLRQQGLWESVEATAAGRGKDEWRDVLLGKPKDLIRILMKSWFPAADALVKLIALHLPSPLEAQRYRAPLLYKGPVDDAEGNKLGNAVATASTAPEAPLMVFVTKLCPISFRTGTKPVLAALCRVLSGRIGVGQEVSVLGPDYEPAQDLDLSSQGTGAGGGTEEGTAETVVKRAKIKRIVTFQGGKESKDVREAVAGDVVGLVGLEDVVVKTATLTQHPLPDEPHRVYGLRTLAFNVAPVVRVAVSAGRAEHATALRLGLRTLQSTDPCVIVETDLLTGEQVVAAAGELHLDVVMSTLQSFVGPKVEIRASEPRLAYRESVGERGDDCLAKSANKLNRIWVRASPLPPALVDALESGILDPERCNAAELSKALVQLGCFDKGHATSQRVWAFGPEGGGGANVLVNTTTGVQGMDGLRQSACAAFKRFCTATASPRPSGCGLCGERLRGVRFDIVDAKVHNDSRHRGPSQIEPAVERALSAAFLSAQPVLYEPTYEVSVTAPVDDLGTLYEALCSRGASDVAHTQESDDVTVHGKLPVALASGLTDELRGVTGGRAFPIVRFAGFGLLEGDCVNGDGRAADVVGSVRMRKGLSAEVPQPSDLVDKL